MQHCKAEIDMTESWTVLLFLHPQRRLEFRLTFTIKMAPSKYSHSDFTWNEKMAVENYFYSR